MFVLFRRRGRIVRRNVTADSQTTATARKSPGSRKGLSQGITLGEEVAGRPDLKPLFGPFPGCLWKC